MDTALVTAPMYPWTTLDAVPGCKSIIGVILNWLVEASFFSFEQIILKTVLDFILPVTHFGCSN